MLLPRHRKHRHLLKSTPDVLRQLLTAAAADAAVAEKTALNPAPFRRQDIPFPLTCAYSRSEPNSASTALSIPSKTAAAASAETNWTSSSTPTVRHYSMEREAPMSILSDNYIDFKQKRVLQIENLSSARPFFYNSYL